uniref:Uncharacterized protein n=1 Tax=Tetranychus urticae TaxID=32264 RepID=T1K6V5_TETUR
MKEGQKVKERTLQIIRELMEQKLNKIDAFVKRIQISDGFSNDESRKRWNLTVP